MLKFEKLTRWFGKKCAVSELSFEVRKGQVLGLLGPNGAGKSTSMKMAAGYLRPSSGRVTLGGHDVWADPVQAKTHLGYLPERAPLYDDLVCSEYLSYMARLRGLEGRDVGYAVDSVVDSCFLQPVRKQVIKTLSKGYRHRLCLAQSLIGDPGIMIFDEPTDGLDPNQKQEIRNLITRLVRDKAIVISTHILEEVEAVCSDVVIIHLGEMVFSGSPDRLRAESADGSRLDLQVRGGDPEAVAAVVAGLGGVGAAQVVSQDGGDYLVEVVLGKAGAGAGSLYQEVARTVADQGAVVLGFVPDRGHVAKSFRDLTTGTPGSAR